MASVHSVRSLAVVLAGTMAFQAIPSAADAQDCTIPDPVGEYQCRLTPQAVRTTIYEFGVCSERPQPSSVSSCVSLFSDAAGRNVELSAGGSVSLVSEISIPEGVYPYSYIKVDTQLSQLATVDVSEFVFKGEPVDEIRAYDGSSGPICWSNGKFRAWSSTAENSNVTCGDAPGEAAFSLQTLSLPEGSILNFSYQVGGRTVVSDFFALDGNGNVATYEIPTGPVDDLTTNAEFIWAAQQLSPALTIDANTNGIDIGIGVTSAGRIDFTQDQAAGCAGTVCVNQISFSGFLLSVVAR